MAFTYDLATNIGKVRLNLGDKVQGSGPWPDGANFQDEEVTQILTQEGGDVMRAVAACCEILANAWSALASVGIGPRREEFNHVSEMFAQRAEKLRATYGGEARAVSAEFKRVDGYSAVSATDPRVGANLSEYYRARQHARYGW